MLDEGDRYGIWLEWDGKEAPTGPAFASRLDGHGRLDVYLHQNGMEMLRDITPAEVFESDLFRRRTNRCRKRRPGARHVLLAHGPTIEGGGSNSGRAGDELRRILDGRIAPSFTPRAVQKRRRSPSLSPQAHHPTAYVSPHVLSTAPMAGRPAAKQHNRRSLAARIEA